MEENKSEAPSYMKQALSKNKLKKIEDQNKLREKPIDVIEPPKAEMPKQEKNPITVTVHNDMMHFTKHDPEEYIISFSSMPIRNINRIDYNVVMGSLTLVMNETTGIIGEQEVPVRNKKGDVTAVRRITTGNITSYKISTEDPDVQEQILCKFYNVTTEELPKVFPGFEAHKIAKKKLEDIMQEKMKEKEESEKSGLVDPLGNKV